MKRNVTIKCNVVRGVFLNVAQAQHVNVFKACDGFVFYHLLFGRGFDDHGVRGDDVERLLMDVLSRFVFRSTLAPSF